MAASAILTNLGLTFSPKLSFSLSPSAALQFIRFPTTSIAAKPFTNYVQGLTPRTALLVSRASVSPSSVANSITFHGLCYVVGDNIDTDQIIPAEYLTLVPSKPEEYEQLGSYALIGLPSSYTTRFIEPNQTKTKYPIIITGANFGCGSSREHAPVALGASGVATVVAEP